MLNQLDTLIGFVVVMSIVSLMITILTQIISSILGLRGQNLASALVAMIHKIDPSIGAQDKSLPATLVDMILQQPVISDSMFSMSSRIAPHLWKRATAIRPDELLQILKDIAGTTAVPANAPATPPQAAARILATLHTTTAATDAALAALNAQLPALAAQSGTDLINQLNSATNVALSNLEKWFNSAQDRAQQWFAMHTRVWTVIFSLIVAFVLQLDTFDLVKTISADPQIRARLEQVSEQLQKENQGPSTTVTAPQPAETQTDNASKLVVELKTLGDTYDKTGLVLFPKPYPNLLQQPLSHALGILVTAALLSLGAPFWFNLLKSLTNLRPALANQVEKNPKQIPESQPAS